MPRLSVSSNVGDPGEDKNELEEALAIVENEIENMIAEGIPLDDQNFITPISCI